MSRKIEAEIRTVRKIAFFILAVGIVFAIISILLFINKNSWTLFPRMDIAWIGFLISSIILCLASFNLAISTSNKQKWIDETDEREMLIATHSAMVGYLIQTTLLGMGVFLLIFMGYLNKVTAFSIFAIIIISGFLSWLYKLFLERTN